MSTPLMDSTNRGVLITLLSDKGINHLHTWEEAIELIEDDVRFHMLCQTHREQVFNSYKRDLEEKNKRVEKKKAEKKKHEEREKEAEERMRKMENVISVLVERSAIPEPVLNELGLGLGDQEQDQEEEG